MNAMKKWVVAGLIGLSSVGVSMATMILDDGSGAYSSTARWDGPNIDTKSSPDAPANVTLYNSAVNNAGSKTVDSIIYNGEEITFSYARQATTDTVATPSNNTQYWQYGDDAETLLGTFAGYTGLTIDFVNEDNNNEQNFSPNLIQDKNYGFYLEVKAIDSDWNYYWFTTDLKGFTAGNKTLDWSTAVPGQTWYRNGIIVGDISTALLSEQIYMFTIKQARDNSTTTAAATWTATMDGIWLEGGVQGVPEPETVWMMLAVLASLAVTFRGQLSDLARRFVKT